MTDKPTDEALENLFVEETGFDIDDFPAAIFDFARAVLAKWGSPAVAGEPQPSAEGPPELWLQLHGDCAEPELSEPVDYTAGDVTWCWHSIHDSDVRYVRADLATAPQPTQTQPVAREQLADERIAEMMRDTWGCASIAPRHAPAFARAVESEVRKSDEALILQLVEALETFDLSHVKDIAKLSEEQFARMLPDFITWFHYAKVIEPAGGEMTGFIWCDDNRPGELTRVDCTDPNTGEQFSIDLENEGADGLKT